MKTALGIAVVAASAASCLALPSSTTRFSDGAEGWVGPQGIGGVGTFIDEKEGEPAPGFHTVFNDFGITFRNETNPEFVQDLTEVDGFFFSIDTKVNQIAFFMQDVSRPWLVEFRDFDAGPNSDQFASVWYKFADISAATHGGWTRFSVQVFDTTADELPEGWRGAGAEDPKTFEPMLPEGITFADVLAGYDQLAITTLEPGFFFGFTDHDVVVDNITLATGSNVAGCNPSDIAEPFGVLDLTDVQCFIEAFQLGDPIADFAAPFDVYDLADLGSFVNAFFNGCP